MAGGRNQFSSEDDDLLTEYLSNFSDGRKGKKIYQQLTEQSTQWPWGIRHPWQSWRHRYTRNSDEFDHLIRVHLKRKRKAASGQLLSVSEGTGQAESSPVTKRKEPPGVESRGQGKRPRTESNLDAAENSSGNPDKDQQKGNTEEQITPSLPDSRVDFIAVDRLRLPDKGKGSSRGRTKQQQVQKQVKKQVRDIQQSDIEKQDNGGGHCSLPPIEVLLCSQDQSDKEKGYTLEAGAGSSASDGDEVDAMLRNPAVSDSPPARDPYNQPILCSTSHDSSQCSSWLSSSDQSLLVNIMVKSMAEQYHLSTDYVLQVWKEAGNLDEAVIRLKRATESNVLGTSHLRATETEQDGTPAGSGSSLPGTADNHIRPMAVDNSGPEIATTESRSGSDGTKVDELNAFTSSRCGPPRDLEGGESWPPERVEIYSLVSSPERKKVLHMFWKKHGDEFLHALE